MLGDRSLTPQKTNSSLNLKSSPKETLNKEAIYNVDDSVLSVDGRNPNGDFGQIEPTKVEINAKEKKSRKKSSWFNTFYPTYKSRSEDFKRIFKDVPDDERLIVDYSCAVHREILVHGRLYVTQNFLCFYANIFSWETNIVLKWKDVAAITKEKTALIIPNAILISTSNERFFFTSFVARDKVYLMLFRMWQNALMDKQMGNREMWQWVHHSYGAELGLTSDDEDYIAPHSEISDLQNNSKNKNLESTLEIENSNVMESTGNFGEEGDKENEGLFNISSSKSDNFREIRFDAQKSDTDSDFSDLEIPSHIDIQNANCICSHDGRLLINDTLPINVDQLFTLMFTNSKFFLDFHASRKNTDVTQGAWTLNANDNSKSRTVSLTVSLTQPIGPKTSQVTETQVMLPCSKAGLLYSINVESLSAGVPYADSFYIETHFCLKKVSKNQTSLSVNAQVKFKKSVWGLVKGMIEKNCWSGLEDFYSALSKALLVECGENFPEVKRKMKRKKKSSPVPNSDPIILKQSPILQPFKEANSDTLKSSKANYFIFAVLIFLLLLNILLYYKLWSLEADQPPSTLFDHRLLKDPPKTPEEWMKLLHKQDRSHSDEIQRWYDLLKKAIDSLKQAEEILSILRKNTALTEDSIQTFDEPLVKENRGEL